MKNIVLKDVNPDKLLKLEAFLQEMNYFTGLVTNFNGPALSVSNVKVNAENKRSQFQLQENGFLVSFNAEVDEDQPKQVDFLINEGKKCLFQAKYTIRNTAYYALQVILNCDSESIINEELIQRFERDFSAEAHVNMTQSLEQLREKEEQNPEKAIENEQPILLDEEEQLDETHMFSENEELIDELATKQSEHVVVDEDLTEEEDVKEEEEISLALTQLSEKIMHAIQDADQIIGMLNDISHDLTRGGSENFAEEKVREQTLENGATVQMIDIEGEEYRITYRKGMLDADAEISFFLERGDQLIFSVYLSSDGHGKISARGENIIQHVKARLEEE